MSCLLWMLLHTVPLAGLVTSTLRGPIPILKLTRYPISPALTSVPADFFFGRPRAQVKRQDIYRIKVSWVALPELSTQGYYVERSLNGITWERRAYLPYSNQHRYQYQDSCLSAAYYRVGRLDFSRRCEFSIPRLAPSLHITPPLMVEPKPGRGVVYLRNYDPNEPVELFNSRGQLVCRISEGFILVRSLLPGTYAIRQGEQITRLVVR